MHPLALAIMGSGVGIVTVSGEDVEATASFPQNAIAIIRFNQNGTVDKVVNGVSEQVDAATDWIIPNSKAPGNYQIRYTNHSGTPLTSAPGNEDEWVALSDGDAAYRLVQALGGSAAASFTIEIRRGGSGSAIASGSYSLSATVS